MVDRHLTIMGTDIIHYIISICSVLNMLAARINKKLKANKNNMKKGRVYISGKISGLDYNHVLLKFEAHEAALKSVGFDPINPLKNGLSPSASWKEHMRADIALLKTCDYIYLQADFTNSRGAMIELFLAIRWGKEIIMGDHFAYNIVLASERARYSHDPVANSFSTEHPVYKAARRWMNNRLTSRIELVTAREYNKRYHTYPF